MAEQYNDSYFYNPYKFNGKELDEESGLYYYGARYYDPRTSLWLSVDPMAQKYPNMSPYNYCANNPVMVVDPDGRDWYETTNEDQSKSVKWMNNTVQSFSDKSGNWQNIGNSYNEKMKDGTYINYYQNYVSYVGDFENEEDMIASHRSFLISTRADIPLGDKTAILNSSVASRGVEQPDMIAITFSGNFYVGGGIGYDVNVGWVKEEGLFSNLALKPGPGVDVSWGLGLTFGDYKGKGKPNATALNNAGTHTSCSLLCIEVSKGLDVSNKLHQIGGNWNTTTIGGSFGSSLIAGGSGGASVTLPLVGRVKFK